VPVHAHHSKVSAKAISDAVAQDSAASAQLVADSADTAAASGDNKYTSY